jgi:hypothetical protein
MNDKNYIDTNSDTSAFICVTLYIFTAHFLNLRSPKRNFIYFLRVFISDALLHQHQLLCVTCYFLSSLISVTKTTNT